jgi:TatA/E family protein of Tat protein translocase
MATLQIQQVCHVSESSYTPHDARRVRLPLRNLRQYDGSMNLGMPEMIFIFLLALIIFGPKKLPEIGRQIGKALGEFKRASNEFKWQLEAEMRQLELDAEREKQAKTASPVLQAPVGTILNTEAQSLPANGNQPPASESAPSSQSADA